MKIKNVLAYTPLALFLVLLFFSVKIIAPYIMTILTSLLLGYMFYPVYRKMKKVTRRPVLSSLITSILIVLIITIPLIMILSSLATEIQTTSTSVKDFIKEEDVIHTHCDESSTSMFCTLFGPYQEMVSEYFSDEQISSIISDFAKSTIANVKDIIFKIPAMIVDFLIMIFIIFFVFLESEKMINKVEKLISIEKNHKKMILSEFERITSGVIYGSLIVALIQGGIGALGFYMFGISSPLLWGIMMAVMALIPFIGTTVIWLPAAIIQCIKGIFVTNVVTTHGVVSYINTNLFSEAMSPNIVIILNGIFLFLYGIFIISLADNILKPKIIGRKAKVHPLLVLLGVLGGIKVFGPMGIIFGPLVLALFRKFIDMINVNNTITGTIRRQIKRKKK